MRQFHEPDKLIFQEEAGEASVDKKSHQFYETDDVHVEEKQSASRMSME